MAGISQGRAVIGRKGMGEAVTWPLVLGTMLVIAGIAVVILENTGKRG